MTNTTEDANALRREGEMEMDDNSLRREFEKLAKLCEPCAYMPGYFDFECGKYVDRGVQRGWEMYQAKYARESTTHAASIAAGKE